MRSDEVIARLGLALVAAALLHGCAAAPVAPVVDNTPSRPALIGMPGESSMHLRARFLVDSCTEKPTTEALIEYTAALLEYCEYALGGGCLSYACNKLHVRDLCQAAPAPIYWTPQ